MRHVIVGASAAGMAAAEAIRRRDPSGEIVVLSDERRPPYYRPLITHLISGDKGEAEILRAPHLVPQGVEVRLARAERLDAAGYSLTLEDGTSLAWDRLLLATGASPVRPDIPGLDGPAAFVLRTWDDAAAIAAAAAKTEHAAILGAGRIGMKAAFALRHIGLSVTVVELLDRVVPQQLDAASAAIFDEVVRRAGITVILGHTIAVVNRRDGELVSVSLNDGREIPAGLLIVGIGVRPDLALAVSGGLHVGRGVIVDRNQRTSAPDVFAAGDVVETTDIVSGKPIVSGLWTNAAGMGRIAGDNMGGWPSAYGGALGLLNSMELGGLPVISAGEVHVEGDGVEVHAERRGRRYRKLVFRGDRLVGMVMVGEVERAGLYAALIREQADVSALRREMLGPRFHYGHFVRLAPKAVDRYVGR